MKIDKYLHYLKYGQLRSYDSICELFEMILSDEIDDNIIYEIILYISNAPIYEDLFLAAIDVFSSKSNKLDLRKYREGDIVDICGTGGDNIGSYNISTTNAFILAAMGINIAKHGGRSVSSMSGSIDILSELKIDLNNLDKIKKSFAEEGLCFLSAPYFNPSFKKVANARKKIKNKTIFNFLGPLLNPAEPNIYMIGCPDLFMSEFLSNICMKMSGDKYSIITSFDKMDEISISDKSYIFHIDENIKYKMKIFDPFIYDIEKLPINMIKGGDAKYNSQKLLELFKDPLDDNLKGYYNISVINSAYIYAIIKNISILDAVTLVKEKLANGDVLRKFNKIININE